MKLNAKLLPFALLPLLFFVLSCSKSNNNSSTKTKTELISQGNWKFSTATIGGSDASAFIQSCQKDNTLSFSASGSGVGDEGATKCNSGDPQSNPFTWNFASNETALHISTVLFTGGSSDFTLVALTESQLVVSQNITISGSTQNAVVTFIH